MRVKVLMRFRDKHTNILHNPGQEIEMTRERYEEINSTSLGVFVSEIAEGNEKETTTGAEEKETQQEGTSEEAKAEEESHETKSEEEVQEAKAEEVTATKPIRKKR